MGIEPLKPHDLADLELFGLDGHTPPCISSRVLSHADDPEPAGGEPVGAGAQVLRSVPGVVVPRVGNHLAVGAERSVPLLPSGTLNRDVAGSALPRLQCRAATRASTTASRDPTTAIFEGCHARIWKPSGRRLTLPGSVE
jgi:hypothetical protein